MGYGSFLFKRGLACDSSDLRKPREGATPPPATPRERRDITTRGRPASFLGFSRAEKMEGNGGARRPAFVVSPAPPPPPPPPPPPSSAEGDEEEQIEEQIEKFYSVLENIKAMRGRWRANPANKRPRREEPLWQPRFLPEDFNNRNEASGKPEGELHSSKDGERKKAKKKEEGGEEESSLDLSLSL